MNYFEAKIITEKYSNDSDDPLVNRAKGFLEGFAQAEKLAEALSSLLKEIETAESMNSFISYEEAVKDLDDWNKSNGGGE